MSQEKPKEFGGYSLQALDVSSPFYPTGSSSQESQNVNLAQGSTENNPPIETAQNGIAFQESLTLSDRDRDIVLSTLEDPPELSETLKSGIRRFRNKYAK